MREFCPAALAGRMSYWLAVLTLVLSGLASPAGAQNGVFPYDNELRLEAAPQRGSKRVPVLQISENGKVDIDLWCVSGKGQAAIAENSITIVPTAMTDNQCSSEQLQRDEELLADITQVTQWKRQGDIVVLNGPKTLRYRMSTN